MELSLRQSGDGGGGDDHDYNNDDDSIHKLVFITEACCVLCDRQP
jgi:hypothetical protein